jgi:uncharacterized iron-regulated membrane protein
MRRALVLTHQWLGLTIGLLWAVQGLTGALFVFSREIDRISGPPVVEGPMVSLDAMLATGLAATHGRPITRMALTDAHRDRVAMYYKDARGAPQAILIDTATGKVAGARELEPATPFTGSASRWIYVTHTALHAGALGAVFIGLSGFVLFTGALTGLWVAWPRWKAWRAAFDFKRWRNTRQRLFGWHRAGGLVVGVMMTVMAVTGIYLTFPSQVRDIIARILPYQVAYSPMAMGGAHPMDALKGAMAGMDPMMHHNMAPLGPQQAVTLALDRFPKAVWVRVFLPTPDEPVYSVRLRQPHEWRAWIGTTSVALDPHTGAILDVYDPLHAPLSNRVLDASFAVHNGELGGLFGRLLAVLLGLSLPALYITGLWAWLNKQRLKSKMRFAKSRPAV